MPREAELSAARDESAVIDVIVGVVTDKRDRVLIGRRPAGKHMAGAWEFPGGKLEDGEAAAAGLKRELVEELGITVLEAEPLGRHDFRYPDRSVRLDVWWVVSYAGRAEPREGQELRWVDGEALQMVEMLPADGPIVAAVCQRLGAG